VHRRSSLLALLLSVLLTMSIAAPARAANSAWDPNDTKNVLDLKWVGIYRQDPDTTRVSITFWNPVRDWMLRWGGPSGALSLESLGMLHHDGWGYMYINYGQNPYGHLAWQATLYDGGSSGILARYPATHPNPFTLLVWLPSSHVTDVQVQTYRGAAVVDHIPSAGWLIPTWCSATPTPCPASLP
jgi:hypothetical protein